MCRPRRTIARQERGGVYGVQASGSYVPDDDRFHAIDSVNAYDFGVRHHRQPTVVRIRGSVEASSRGWRSLRYEPGVNRSVLRSKTKNSSGSDWIVAGGSSLRLPFQAATASDELRKFERRNGHGRSKAGRANKPKKLISPES
jgi:hypothetical protein